MSKLKSPRDFEFWLSDTKDAYEEVKKRFSSKVLDISKKEEFYKIAPLIAAERRHIKDDSLVLEMMEFTSRNVEQDFSIDPKSKKLYQFQFVIAYVHSHAPAGIFTEMEGDRIMEYINGNWDLFENA